MDAFETVAIAHSQPQAAVLLSFLHWHGIPAFAMNLETVRTLTHFTVALGGIPIRVHRDAASDAHALLAEIEADHSRDEPPRRAERQGAVVAALLCFLLVGAAPPPRMAAVLLDRDPPN